MTASSGLSARLIQAALESLGAVGSTEDLRIADLPGGANNRVFHMRLRDREWLLKVYYSGPHGDWDRLRTERDFYRFCAEAGLRLTPNLLADDLGLGYSVFEYVRGRKLRRGEVTGREVDQALDFALALHLHRDAPRARALPEAAEACFSLRDHIACAERRISRLAHISIRCETDRAAAHLVRSELRPRWYALRDRLLGEARRSDLSIEDSILHRERCISPSDFGFHNALLRASGELSFFDFEYAGWDDPAKLVCDFFCQPQIPVPESHLEHVLARLDAMVPDRAVFELRVRLLLPLYRLKWCCIALNEFLPTGAARRRFSQVGMDEEQAKKIQLQKTRDMLRTISDTSVPGRPRTTSAPPHARSPL